MLEWGVKLKLFPQHSFPPFACSSSSGSVLPCFVAVAAAVLLIILVALAFVFK
jgi:hypothetical protein